MLRSRPMAGSDTETRSASMETVTEVYDRIVDLLMAFAKVASGDLSTRLDSGLPETHPLGALCVGVNDMIDSLQAEQQRTAQYQSELEEKLATIRQQNEDLDRLAMDL